MAGHAGVVVPAAEPDFDGAESEAAAGSSIAGCVRDARAVETGLHGTGLETDPWLDMLVWWPQLLSLISTVRCRSLLLDLRLLVVSGMPWPFRLICTVLGWRPIRGFTCWCGGPSC